MASYLSATWSYFRASHPSPALDTYSVVQVDTEEYVLPTILARDGGLILHQLSDDAATTVDYNIVLHKEASTFR